MAVHCRRVTNPVSYKRKKIMSTWNVVHVDSGASDIIWGVKYAGITYSAFTKARAEKVYYAYGTIPGGDGGLTAAYAVGDTLSFGGAGIKDLIYAKFVSSVTAQSLELFNSASLASAISFNIKGSGTTHNINYFIQYVHGGSLSNPQGQPLQLTITSTS